MKKPFIKTFKHFRAAIEFLESPDFNENVGNYDIETSVNTVVISPTGKRPDGYYKEVEVVITFQTEQQKFNYNYN